MVVFPPKPLLFTKQTQSLERVCEKLVYKCNYIVFIVELHKNYQLLTEKSSGLKFHPYVTI